MLNYQRVDYRGEKNDKKGTGTFFVLQWMGFESAKNHDVIEN
jgi:hypothetical protein